MKAHLYDKLGQHKSAVDNYQQADEAFAKADRIGSLTVVGHSNWMLTLNNLATAYLSVHQLEYAKRCCLRVLASPHVMARDRVLALHGMARYHQERSEW
jgi:Tfp pilus assembly protein PilF